MSRLVSVAPDGVAYPLPDEVRNDADYAELSARCADRTVVVVQGLGFVGSAVCAAVAAVRDENGRPRYFVIGVDLPTSSSYWKIAKINAGEEPVPSADRELRAALFDAVLVTGNLAATFDPRVYGLAAVIIMDVQLDVSSHAYDASPDILVETGGFTAAASVVGRWMREDALVLVETTVPVGTTARIVAPAIQAEFGRRGITRSPLIAHCYERVMPGANYLNSIRAMSRCYAGVDEASTTAAREFLDSITVGSAVTHRALGTTTASEMAKLLENSYRAANIAFIHEWTLLAEASGVNLWEVVDAIRVRKGTHDNMRYPGFGVGGYCLTKDSLLAQWGGEYLLGVDVTLGTTLRALQTNFHMPLHTVGMVSEILGGDLSGRKILLCGISYLPDVGDTRNSPSEIFADAVLAAGAELVAHDPNVRHWPERPKIAIVDDVQKAIAESDAVVFALPHKVYRDIPSAVVARGRCIVDANNVLDDSLAREIAGEGARVAGVGKGHWRAANLHQRP